MPTPTEQSLDSVKIHKVPNLEVWEQNYKTTENPNGLIEPGDLVSFPPNLLGEVLPDYPDTAGITFLKATTTGSGTGASTTTTWGTVDALPQGATPGKVLGVNNSSEPEWQNSATGGLMTVVTTIDQSSDNTTIPTAAAVWNARPSVPVTSVNTQTGDVSLTAANVGAIPTTAKGAASGVATLDTNVKVEADQTTAKIIDSATLVFNNNIYSLKTIENGCLIVDTNSGTNEHIYQIEPYNSSSSSFYHYSTGTEIEIMKIGTGIVKIQPNSGVSLNGATALKTISDQYTSAVLKYLGNDSWVIQGAIS